MKKSVYRKYQANSQYTVGGWIKKSVKNVGKATGLGKAFDWTGDVVGEDIRSGVKKVTGAVADLGGDYLTYNADNLLGVFGAGDMIKSDDYETKFAGKVSDATSKYIAPVLGQAAATAVAGPVGGAILGGVQSGVGAGMQASQTAKNQRAYALQQQELANQSFGSQRIASLNSPMNNYSMDFKYGGKMCLSNPYSKYVNQMQRGGQMRRSPEEVFATQDTIMVNKKPATMNQAYYNYVANKYAESMPKDLMDRFRAGLPTKMEDKVAYADRFAKDNPSFYAPIDTTDTRYMSALKSLEKQYKSPTTGTDTVAPNAFGARQAALINPAVTHIIDDVTENGQKYLIRQSSYDTKYTPEQGYQSSSTGLTRGPYYNTYFSGLRKYGGSINDMSLDGITEYPVGGTHEENKYGGVMIGNGNSVEQGEVRYKDYIFSNRLKRRK
jgi:hypothetical protein